MVRLLLVGLTTAVTCLPPSCWESTRCQGSFQLRMAHCNQCTPDSHAPFLLCTFQVRSSIQWVGLPQNGHPQAQVWPYGTPLCLSDLDDISHCRVVTEQTNCLYQSHRRAGTGPFSRGAAFWRGGRSAPGSWLEWLGCSTQLLSGSGPVCSPVHQWRQPTSKLMDMWSCLRAWALQTCVSVQTVNMQREIPPVVHQIQACFPLEWNLHTYVDSVFTWKAGTCWVFWHCLGKQFQKFSTWCFSGFLSVPQTMHGSVVYSKAFYENHREQFLYKTVCELIP